MQHDPTPPRPSKEPRYEITQAFEAFQDHLYHTNTDKYEQEFSFHTEMMMSNKHGRASNIFAAGKYLDRYITDEFPKSYQMKDLLKACHYLLFEYQRRVNQQHKSQDAGPVEEGNNVDSGLVEGVRFDAPNNMSGEVLIGAKQPKLGPIYEYKFLSNQVPGTIIKLNKDGSELVKALNGQWVELVKTTTEADVDDMAIRAAEDRRFMQIDKNTNFYDLDIIVQKLILDSVHDANLITKVGVNVCGSIKCVDQWSPNDFGWAPYPYWMSNAEDIIRIQSNEEFAKSEAWGKPQSTEHLSEFRRNILNGIANPPDTSDISVEKAAIESMRKEAKKDPKLVFYYRRGELVDKYVTSSFQRLTKINEYSFSTFALVFLNDLKSHLFHGEYLSVNENNTSIKRLSYLVINDLPEEPPKPKRIKVNCTKEFAQYLHLKNYIDLTNKHLFHAKSVRTLAVEGQVIDCITGVLTYNKGDWYYAEN